MSTVSSINVLIDFKKLRLYLLFRKRVNSNISFKLKSQFSYCIFFFNFREIEILRLTENNVFNNINAIPSLPPELQVDQSLKTAF